LLVELSLMLSFQAVEHSARFYGHLHYITSIVSAEWVGLSRLNRGRPLDGGAPFSNSRRIRGSCGGDVAIERRGRDAEAMRDLSYADVGISQHRLGGLDVVVRELRWTASRTTDAPRGGKSGLGPLADQAPLEFANAPNM
jgi:hypothetical protein